MMASVLIGITILFTVAWCAAGLLHRASAALRHVIWTCAFAAVFLLAPLRWRVPHRVISSALPVVVGTTVVAGQATAAPSFDPTTVLLALWWFGTAVMTLRLIRNAVRLRSIVRSAQGGNPIRVSSRIRGPLVAGVFRPLILLPHTSNSWTVSRRRAVLAHEAAHIRRCDPAILFLSHIVTALYWFHPLCWLAAARLRAESESACDDAALRIGLRPSGYAGHLLDLARKFDTQLAIPMATTTHLESRVKSILDPKTNRSFPARATWLAAVALTAAVLAPLATLTLRAQQPTGASAITGVVIDPSGAVVPNARVTVMATTSDEGYSVQATTNAIGRYSFNSLAAGRYTIIVQSPGFRMFQLNNLALVNGGSLQTDAHLQVGDVTQAVTVTAPGAPRLKPAAGPASSGPIRVGGMVQAANPIRQVKPAYPADLQAQGVEATVSLKAIISKDGVPLSLSVQTPTVNREFIDAALAAVSQWRYKPTLLNGEPIEVMTSIDVNFTLRQ